MRKSYFNTLAVIQSETDQTTRYNGDVPGLNVIVCYNAVAVKSVGQALTTEEIGVHRAGFDYFRALNGSLADGSVYTYDTGLIVVKYPEHLYVELKHAAAAYPIYIVMSGYILELDLP